MDTSTLKALIRLQSTAEGLLQVAEKATSNHERLVLRDRIGLMANEIVGVMKGSAALTDEFARVFDPNPESHTRHSVPTDAAAIVGWLRGVIAAETHEARLRAEAEAYAQARVKEERGVGFSGAG